MLTETELELHARHLSLPEIGEAGQQRLCACRVFVDPDLLIANELRRVLPRLGFSLVDQATNASWRVVKGTRAGLLVEPGEIAVGSQENLAIEGIWLVGLVATELIAVVLGWRTPQFKVEVAFLTHCVR